MLIICTGPDTWSAHEKARDLAKGFRDKYDSTGASVTTIHEATFSEVMNQFGAPSLFAKKVFVRADGWMSKIKPEDFKKLHERILKDGDMTILVAVMDELPVKIDSVLKECKTIIYSFPLKTGKAFVDWCRDQGKRMGYDGSVEDIAEMHDGDTWAAVSEILKRKANPQSPLSPNQDVDASNFDISDAVLLEQNGWRNNFASSDDPDGVVVALLSSLRSLFKIESGNIDGVHPFVQQKMRRLKIVFPKKKFLYALRTFVLTRTSRGTIDETILHE